MTLDVGAAPFAVEIPKDFLPAVKKAGLARDFAALAFIHRKEHARAMEQAKAPETRLRRIDKAVAMITAKNK